MVVASILKTIANLCFTVIHTLTTFRYTRTLTQTLGHLEFDILVSFKLNLN